jgi:hypothetical protein
MINAHDIIVSDLPLLLVFADLPFEPVQDHSSGLWRSLVGV